MVRARPLLRSCQALNLARPRLRPGRNQSPTSSILPNFQDAVATSLCRRFTLSMHFMHKTATERRRYSALTRGEFEL
jgi:hypothetical protein